jgi:hypothetical protein
MRSNNAADNYDIMRHQDENAVKAFFCVKLERRHMTFKAAL